MPKVKIPKIPKKGGIASGLKRLGANIMESGLVKGMSRGLSFISDLLSPEQTAGKEKDVEDKKKEQSQTTSTPSPQQAGLKEGLTDIFNIVAGIGRAIGKFLSDTGKLVKEQMTKSKDDKDGKKDQSEPDNAQMKGETAKGKDEKQKEQNEEAKSEKKDNPVMAFLKLLGNLLLEGGKALLFAPKPQQTKVNPQEQMPNDNDEKDAAANKGALKIVPAPSLSKLDNFANDILSGLKRNCYRKATAEQTANGSYKFGLGKGNGDMTINADKTRINLSNCNEKSLEAGMQAAAKIGGAKANIDISGIPKGQLDNAWMAAKRAGLKPTGHKPADGSDVRKQWGEEKDFMKKQVGQNKNLNRNQERQDNNQTPQIRSPAKPAADRPANN